MVQTRFYTTGNCPWSVLLGRGYVAEVVSGARPERVRSRGGPSVGALSVRVAAGCAVLALGLLAGCSGSAPEPAPLQSSSTPPSASSDPHPASSPTSTTTPLSPPTLPTEDLHNTSASAAKAGRHFIRLINFSLHTGSTSAMRQMAAPGCTTCEALAGKIDMTYRAGGHVEGGAWTVISTEVTRSRVAGPVFVRMAVQIARQREFPRARAKATSSAATSGHVECVMAWRTNTWVVSRFGAYA